MEEQKKVGLIKRPPTVPLIPGRNHTPGYDLGEAVQIGDIRDLMLDTKPAPERVQITIADILGDNKFRARIDSFELQTGSEYQGYKEGDMVDIGEEDIWPQNS